MDVIVVRHNELDEGATCPVFFPEDVWELEPPGVAGGVIPVLTGAIGVPPPND